MLRYFSIKEKYLQVGMKDRRIDTISHEGFRSPILHPYRSFICVNHRALAEGATHSWRVDEWCFFTVIDVGWLVIKCNAPASGKSATYFWGLMNGVFYGDWCGLVGHQVQCTGVRKGATHFSRVDEWCFFTVIDVCWLVIKCTQMGIVDNAPASGKVQRTFGFRIHQLFFPFSRYFFSICASHHRSGEVEDRPPTRLAAEVNAPVSSQRFSLSTFHFRLFPLFPFAFSLLATQQPPIWPVDAWKSIQ